MAESRTDEARGAEQRSMTPVLALELVAFTGGAAAAALTGWDQWSLALFIALVAFSRFNDKLDGQVLVFFIITVAAAEVSVGLALIVALYRRRQSAHLEDLTSMKL